jgi:hypothetical protein
VWGLIETENPPDLANTGDQLKRRDWVIQLVSLQKAVLDSATVGEKAPLARIVLDSEITPDLSKRADLVK